MEGKAFETDAAGGSTYRVGRAAGRDRRRDQRIAGLERDLESDRRQYARMLARYEELRNELEDLNQAIGRRQRLLDALRESTPAEISGRRSAPAPGTKPAIAREILWGSLEPLYPRQVRDIAVEKGWLDGGEAARNQLSVAMSKMARKGRLVKGSDGRYGLPDRAAG
jgi:hypothetical protein